MRIISERFSIKKSNLKNDMHYSRGRLPDGSNPLEAEFDGVDIVFGGLGGYRMAIEISVLDDDGDYAGVSYHKDYNYNFDDIDDARDDFEEIVRMASRGKSPKAIARIFNMRTSW